MIGHNVTIVNFKFELNIICGIVIIAVAKIIITTIVIINTIKDIPLFFIINPLHFLYINIIQYSKNFFQYLL